MALPCLQAWHEQSSSHHYLLSQCTLEDITIIPIPHEHQHQWTWGFFQLSEEDLIRFFPTKQLVADTHRHPLHALCWFVPYADTQALSLFTIYPAAELHPSLLILHIQHNSPFLPPFPKSLSPSIIILQLCEESHHISVVRSNDLIPLIPPVCSPCCGH